MRENKGKKWNIIMSKLKKECRASYKIQVAYETLRSAFLKAGGTASGTMPSVKVLRIAKKMQDLEAKVAAIWKPHQKLVGACQKCKGVRVPGMMPNGYGFGCVTCHDFEIFVSSAA